MSTYHRGYYPGVSHCLPLLFTSSSELINSSLYIEAKLYLTFFFFFVRNISYLDIAKFRHLEVQIKFYFEFLKNYFVILLKLPCYEVRPLEMHRVSKVLKLIFPFLRLYKVLNLDIFLI